MDEFKVSNSEWNGYELDNDSQWSGITCDRSLLDFLKDEDHIISIQKYFIDISARSRPWLCTSWAQ